MEWIGYVVGEGDHVDGGVFDFDVKLDALVEADGEHDEAMLIDEELVHVLVLVGHFDEARVMARGYQGVARMLVS